ncbi:hypothetical protein HDU97_006874 [Phlyctochytrium planicorne]|nr:hypothetical protein HDU97_006874 [Phlyctochytrium planicorne]
MFSSSSTRTLASSASKTISPPKSHLIRSLSSARPARSFDQSSPNRSSKGSGNSNNSSSSSGSGDGGSSSSNGNASSTPLISKRQRESPMPVFHATHWTHPVLAESSFWCKYGPLVAMEAHFGTGIDGERFSGEILERAMEKLSVAEEVEQETAPTTPPATAASFASKSNGVVPGPPVRSKVLISPSEDRYWDEYATIFGSKRIETAAAIDQVNALLEGQQEGQSENTEDLEWVDIPTTQAQRQALVDASHTSLYDSILKIPSIPKQPTNGRRTRRNSIPRTSLSAVESMLHPFTLPRNESTSLLWSLADGSTGTEEEVMEMISIKKIRRKKMNKHKWKKRRRLVRDSSRYNKEKRKKSGPLREKQE